MLVQFTFTFFKLGIHAAGLALCDWKGYTLSVAGACLGTSLVANVNEWVNCRTDGYVR